MNKEFIPYEQALALKELGFDEPCFGKFYYNQLEIGGNWCNNDFKEDPDIFISAPTFSQAFKFFRDKYKLRGSIMDFLDDELGIEWDYEIAIIGTDIDENGNYKALVDYSIDDEDRKFKTYEETELACLKKLIEIVKNNKNE